MKARRLLRHLLIPLLLLPGSVSLRAEVVDNLYSVAVPVTDQGRETRTRALTEALREVLIRVSGRDLLDLMEPGVETALALPTRYVQRYRYESREVDGQRQLLLQVRFDAEAVNRLLRDNRLPVWGRNRPSVLAWVVVDDRQGRKLITGDSPAALRELVAREGARRGLPLRLPLYDLTDRARLTVSDVWGNFEDRILDASQRYQTEAVLVGKIYKTFRNRWRSRWTLYNEGRRDDWQAEGNSLAAVFATGVNRSSRLLAARYARVADSSQPGVVRVQVVGIHGLADYARAIRYLATLDGVRQAAPEWVTPQSVVFALVSRNGLGAVSRAIALGHVLVPESAVPVVPDTATPGAASGTTTTPPRPVIPDLVYRLVP